MKKILTLAAAALLCCAGAQAQIVTSKGRSIKTVTTVTKTPKTTTWLVRAGIGFMNGAGGDKDKLLYDCFDSDTKGKGKVGYDLSVEFNRQLGNVKGLYWGMEAGFGSRGAKCEGTDEWEDGSNYEFKEDKGSIVAHNIRVSPFIIGYKYHINDDFALDAHYGVFLSFDYAGKAESSWTLTQGRIYGDGDVDLDTESGSESHSKGDWKDEVGDNFKWKSIDAGFRLGAGIWYKNFNLDFTWHRGLIAPAENYGTSYSVCASNFLIRLGMSF